MSIKKFLFPFLLLCTVLALIFRVFARPVSAKQASNRASYDAIDVYIERQMRRLNIPGASLAIVEGDQVMYLRNFGQARPGGEAPTSQTPFLIGSLTKSFTAMAVMQLVESGKIELDAPVQRYLPWFRVADSQASAQITVRHLLNQTSGLPELPGEVALADFDDSPDAVERQARALAALELAQPVGSTCIYSNLNYNLLGLVVEAASGEAYDTYLQRHIFAPLEMRHSYTSQAEAKQNGLAVGHRYWFALPFASNLPIPRGSLPSGQLISSAEDMAHYLIASLNEGAYGKAQIVSGASIREMHRGAAEYVKFGVSAGQYGMGWFVDKIGSTEFVWHGGNVPDYSAFMALLPGQKKGVVLLINADHYGFPPILAEVGTGVAALLAGQQPAPLQLGIVPWLMRALPLIPLLQIAGVFATVRSLHRWRQDPALRPSRGRMWGAHILLPLIPNLSLAALPVLLLPNGMYRFLSLFMPDFTWIALICGGFAGIWAFLRSGLILHTLRDPSPSQASVGQFGAERGVLRP